MECASDVVDGDALDGIPAYMLRKARVVTASRDPQVLKAFILANYDQHDEFWITEQQAVQLERAKSATVLHNAVSKLGQASEDVLTSMGLNGPSITAAASLLGINTLSTTSASSGVETFVSPLSRSASAVPVPESDDSELVPVPDDDDDLLVSSVARTSTSRWTTLRHLMQAASRFASLPRHQPSHTEFQELANDVTANTWLRDSLDAQQLSLVDEIRHPKASTTVSDWLSQLDEDDLVEVKLPTKEAILGSSQNQTSSTNSAPVTGDDWITAPIHGIEYDNGQVLEISIVFNPSKLSSQCPLFDSDSDAKILAFKHHSICDQILRQRKRTIFGKKALETIHVKCNNLKDSINPVWTSQSRQNYWSPTTLKEKDKVEVLIQLHTFVRPKDSPVCLPYEPNIPKDHWVEGRVVRSSPWMGGSRLLEISIPDDVEKPCGQNRVSNRLVLWDFDPEFTPVSLGSALAEVMRAAREELGTGADGGMMFMCTFRSADGSPNCAYCTASSAVDEETRKIVLRRLRDTPLHPPGAQEASACDSRQIAAHWETDMQLVLRPQHNASSVPVSLTSVGARFSQVPGRQSPSVLICAEVVPRNIRCAASLRVAQESPEALVGHQAKVRGTDSRWVGGEIIAYAAKQGKHILMTGPEQVRMVGLSNPSSFILDPTHPTLCISRENLIAEMGTNLKSCVVCYTSFAKDDESKETGFASFCYEIYHVDGHTVDIRQPRHPGKLCHECLRRHCETALKDGKLYVRCPMEHCGRALQIRELSGIVSQTIYDTLMTRLQEAEEQEEPSNDEVLSAGVKLKQCPRCKVRIEKNEGCSTMQCYRCGHVFNWSEVAEITPKLPVQHVSLDEALSSAGFGVSSAAFEALPPNTTSADIMVGTHANANRQNPRQRSMRRGRGSTRQETLEPNQTGGDSGGYPAAHVAQRPSLERTLTEDL